MADLDSFEVLTPDTSYLDDVFGDGGLFASRFPGYRSRPGQIQLAQAVHHALETRTHLVSEAPTGVGKSASVIVPSSKYVSDDLDRRVVIVTANISLQEQYVTKDLPLIQSIVPWEFSFGLLKGRNNYLCLKKYYELEAETKDGQRLLFADAAAKDSQHRHLPIVYEWAKSQVKGHGSGDVSTVPVQPDAAVWNRFSTTPDDCPGQKCAHAIECFANRAQAAARSSQILVTNYAMLLLDLKLYRERQMDYIIGPFDAVICDEAHTLGPTAQDFFGFELHHGMVSWLARSAKDRTLRDRIESMSRDAFGALETHRRSAKYAKRLKEPVPGLIPLIGALGQLANDFRFQKEDADEEEKVKLDRKIQRASDMCDAFSEAATLTEDSPLVFSIQNENERTVLQARLFRPSYALKSGLFEHTKNEQGEGEIEIGDPVSVVCVSATLATSSGDLGFFAREVGAVEPAMLTVASPFDWPRNAVLVTPPMPLPNDPSFPRRAAETTEQIIRKAKGRTLALFTSYRVLDAVHEHLLRARLPYRIYRQGELPRTELLRRFREDISSVLLGTESFWAGVDVPGESLSVVVVDKLPFPHFDDPVMDKHQAVDPNAFGNQMMPRALLQWRQGCGRLLRSETDRGVLVCLDCRITEKGYGKQFVRAIGIPTTLSLDIIETFLPQPKVETWPDE